MNLKESNYHTKPVSNVILGDVIAVPKFRVIEPPLDYSKYFPIKGKVIDIFFEGSNMFRFKIDGPMGEYLTQPLEETFRVIVYG